MIPHLKIYGYECEQLNSSNTDESKEEPAGNLPRSPVMKVMEQSRIKRGIPPVKKPVKKPVTANLTGILEEMKQFL